MGFERALRGQIYHLGRRMMPTRDPARALKGELGGLRPHCHDPAGVPASLAPRLRCGPGQRTVARAESNVCVTRKSCCLRYGTHVAITLEYL
jgi:hypothetical protein